MGIVVILTTGGLEYNVISVARANMKFSHLELPRHIRDGKRELSICDKPLNKALSQLLLCAGTFLMVSSHREIYSGYIHAKHPFVDTFDPKMRN